MRFSPGTRLGSYEILAELGAGGMGEVYRARDSRLERDVALKLVSTDFCSNPDSMTRLRQEARALATLHHPHVASVHQLDEVDGICCIVMELVPGETLQQLLATRHLAVREALELAIQIASALEAAHDRGIVHRDLKPANIKITPDGTAKVLDFGLAKAERPERDRSSGAPIPTSITETGMIVGTVSYMSPEQARGRHVDRRTDIWAFGCVLYEMLTGRMAFGGESHSDTLVSILERQPDLSLLPAETPPGVRTLLRRSLEKDAKRRLRDAGDLRLELEDALNAPAAPEHVAPQRKRLPRSPAAMVIAALFAIGIAYGGWAGYQLVQQGSVTSVPPARFVVSLPAGEQLGGTDFPAVVISPDSRLIAYISAQGGRTQLALRPLDAFESTIVSGTNGATSPFFSPDGLWVAFFAEGYLKKISVTGGPPITICEAATGLGGTWGRDGTIVFSSSTGSALSRVSANGGTSTRVTKLDAGRGEFSHRWPEWLDESSIVFTVGTVGNWDEAEIAAQSLNSGQPTIVLKGGTHPHYLPSGHLLYTHSGAVWSVPFDRKRLTTTGQPVKVLDAVLTSADGAAQFAVSASGTEVYVGAVGDPAVRRLIVVDRATVTPYAAPARAYVSPRVSPDGRKLLVTIADETEQIWIYDITDTTLTQRTFDASNWGGIWTPDAQRITFSSNRSGALNLYSIRADGSGSPERLAPSDNLQIPGSWSPDGQTLAFVEQHAGTGRDIFLLKANGERATFAQSTFDESAPRFSPDGRSIAFVSNETGRAEIYVKTTSQPSRQRRVTNEGGTEPVWGYDGRSLFYRSGNRVMVVALAPDGAAADAPRVQFEQPVEPGTFDSANYDVLPGTDRLLMITSSARGSTLSEFRVLLNRSIPSLPLP
jgi:eukaryotic-like serine/threonine-protein kinase